MSEKKGLARFFDTLKKRDPRRELPADVTLGARFGEEMVVHPKDYVLNPDQEQRFDDVFTPKPERRVVVSYFANNRQEKVASVSLFFGHPKNNEEVMNIIDDGKVYIYPTYINFIGEDGEKLRSKFPMLAMVVHGDYFTDKDGISVHQGSVKLAHAQGRIPTQRLYQVARGYLREQGLPDVAFLDSCDKNSEGNNVDYDQRWNHYPSGEDVLLGVEGDLNFAAIFTEGFAADEKTITNVDINLWKLWLKERDQRESPNKTRIHRYTHTFGRDHPLRPLVDALFESKAAENPNLLRQVFSTLRRRKHVS